MIQVFHGLPQNSCAIQYPTPNSPGFPRPTILPPSNTQIALMKLWSIFSPGMRCREARDNQNTRLDQLDIFERKYVATPISQPPTRIIHLDVTNGVFNIL